MVRFRISALALGALALSSMARAEIVSSGELVVNGGDAGIQVVFDFPTVLSPDTQITAISVDWEINLPEGVEFPGGTSSTTELQLVGDLAFNGDILGTGFYVGVSPEGGSAGTEIIKPISDEMSQALIDAIAEGEGQITFDLAANGDLEALLGAVNPEGEAPSLNATIKLLSTPDERGNGNVPEPATLLLLAVGAPLALRRLRRGD
jgi:hypothetical protein